MTTVICVQILCSVHMVLHTLVEKLDLSSILLSTAACWPASETVLKLNYSHTFGRGKRKTSGLLLAVYNLILQRQTSLGKSASYLSGRANRRCFVVSVETYEDNCRLLWTGRSALKD
jgi:hypothetical protein